MDYMYVIVPGFKLCVNELLIDASSYSYDYSYDYELCVLRATTTPTTARTGYDALRTVDTQGCFRDC